MTVDHLLHPGAAPKRERDLHSRKIITAISLLGLCCLALIAYALYPSWLIFIYLVPAAAIVWLVLNAAWFPARFNYPLISVLMWSALGATAVTLWQAGNPLWGILLAGIPGQAIICLSSRFRKKKNAAA